MATTYVNRRQTTGGTWFVTEIGEDGIAVGIMLLGENDRTAGLPTPYDSRCTMCYLGHAHSQLVHKASLARHFA